MGIGNKVVLEAISRIGSGSLPLMGIGNQSGRLGCLRSKSTHYPSWGLETVGITIHRHGGHLLITPHGDWKPHPAHRGHAESQAHYPSWGLETREARRSLRDSPCLITPHGDWKLVGLGAVLKPDLNSLPLMGIGNPPVGRFRLRRGNLITPHGDWKLCGHLCG